MTDIQKRQIRRQREKGKSYNEISRSLGISVSNVKMFCARNGIEPLSVDSDETVLCKQCGKEFVSSRDGRPPMFCSDGCRLKFWRSNRSARKTPEKVCPGCGETFSSYVNTRKYCSHECYIIARFGGGRHGA